MSDAPQLGLEQEYSLAQERPVPCERLIGLAGSGKTTTLMRRMEADPDYGLLTATTGIAAVNLSMGAVTMHSALHVNGDPFSLRDAFISGRLATTLHAIALRRKWFVIEEYSMLHAEQLQMIYRGVREANRYGDMRDRDPLGILLVGDLAQLPPVKGEWCFEAECWPEFAANTTRLDKVWRQDGGPFLDALNLLRNGNGNSAAALLDVAGAKWHTQLDGDFDGTTILPKNRMVSRHNDLALDRVPGPRITVTSRRWGKQQPEWGESRTSKEWGIPPRADFKSGALVMILANRPDFSVVNGDSGIIEGYDGYDNEECFHVRLLRTGEVVEVDRIIRGVEQDNAPDNWPDDAPRYNDADGAIWMARPHYRSRAKRYVLGQVEYFPLRLAYATSVHKSQSLTLDFVQCDFRDHFFSTPAMLYVALSRCRTLEGLRLVGSKERFAAQCHTDERVLPWI
jgi:ATP-dependent DNA helicase PIF1